MWEIKSILVLFESLRNLFISEIFFWKKNWGKQLYFALLGSGLAVSRGQPKFSARFSGFPMFLSSFPASMNILLKTAEDRLTCDQTLFTRNPSPRKSFKISFDYLLLSPRSVPKTVPCSLTPNTSTHMYNYVRRHNE